MSKPSFLRHPSLETSTSASASTGDTTFRHSLFDTKDEFIERIAPVGVAAIYFGSFSLSPQDAPLPRQALFKLSFLNRHFLQPGGLRIVVNRQTAVLSGTVTTPSLVTMADILARQIEGILNVENATQSPASEITATTASHDAIRETVQFLFATDQTLRSGVQVRLQDGHLLLQGEVSSPAQKQWAEQLAETTGAEVHSALGVSTSTSFAHMAEPPMLDDESLQALVLFRLRLVRDTEHLPLRVKANRGVVTISGKVRTEALRQRAENLSRSTLGLRELRSSLSIAA
jgi:osmotically-inducible protein OsmY